MQVTSPLWVLQTEGREGGRDDIRGAESPATSSSQLQPASLLSKLEVLGFAGWGRLVGVGGGSGGVWKLETGSLSSLAGPGSGQVGRLHIPRSRFRLEGAFL